MKALAGIFFHFRITLRVTWRENYLNWIEFMKFSILLSSSSSLLLTDRRFKHQMTFKPLHVLVVSYLSLLYIVCYWYFLLVGYFQCHNLFNLSKHHHLILGHHVSFQRGIFARNASISFLCFGSSQIFFGFLGLREAELVWRKRSVSKEGRVGQGECTRGYVKASECKHAIAYL